MHVLIGAPVYDRSWILPDYFAAIEAQDFPLSDVGFIFTVSPDDEETVQCLRDFGEAHPELREFDIFVDTTNPHTAHAEGFRSWPREKYHTMSNFRNGLLDRAKAIGPDRYLSLDTDIILENPRTISELVQLTAASGLDAVAPLLFMTPEGMDFPNSMSWASPQAGDGMAGREPLYKYPFGKVFRSDVIMAAVMMTRAVYENTRYKWHKQGEDLGWSGDCHARGYRLHIASYLYAAHIMSRAALATYKANGDPRAEYVDIRRKEAFADG
jgi:hypothetical protein